MKTMRQLCLLVSAFLVCLASYAQTNPTPQAIPYSQDFSTLAATATVYPVGMQGWNLGTSPSATYRTTTATADVVLTASGSASSTSLAVYNYNGKVGFLNTGSGDLSIGLALDATGKSNIQVGYDIMTIRNPYDGGSNTRINEVSLQYRIGTTGNFTTLTGVEYTNNTTLLTTAGSTTPQNTQAKSITLPATCNNQPVVQIRWVSRQLSGAGARPSFAIDNISVAESIVKTATVAVTTNASEPSSNGVFTINLSIAAPVGGVTVNYSLSGTATLNSDYTNPQGGSITIAEGNNSGTVTLNVMDDALYENTKTITLTLTGADNGYSASSNATINLLDDDINLVSFTTGGYTQDFNSLVATGSSGVVPVGWAVSESGTSANTNYQAGDGSTNSGDTYSFGTSNLSDRAFGGLRSSSVIPSIGAAFSNNTGATISSLNITYTGEQWRLGATGRADRLDFQYSINASNLKNGTWTDVDALDFIAPISSGTVGMLDGNSVANSKTTTYNLSGLAIPAGATFIIRWNDYDASGADDGLAVDDFSITLGCTAPSNQPTALTLTPSLQTITGTFTPAAAGTNAADEYLVVMSTSSTLSLPPASGTVYAIDDEIGNGVVVGTGSGTSFTVNNLTPGTTYYYFIYSVTAATSCYNITSPLTGTIATTTPPPCTAPTTQASSLSASNITGSSMDISYTRGNGDNIIVLARAGSAVNANPTSGASYATGDQIGSGNYVVYNGPASSFSYTGLSQNTTYYFAAFDYFSADNCYNLTPLTGSFNTICSTPVDVNALSATATNGQVTIKWTNPVVGCFDEVLVVTATTSITSAGSTFTGTPNTTYSGGNQVVYRGTANTVTITGLTNGTTYFFKVFGKLGSNYSNGVQVTANPYDPATGYQYLYGNLHAHSSYSDGNKDDLTKTPKDDYIFARDAQCMDFMGMSEHNHTGAGMAISDYKLGYAQADEVNMVAGGTSGNSMVTLFGMEWGVISGGGHVLVYGFDDQLIGWEASNYDVYVAKNDYASLWTEVNGKAGAIATLAHPNSTDFGGIASTFSQTADNAIYGVALASGPAFSTSKTYSDFPASLSYLNYYKTMLSKGYHLAPQMDQDNHNMTFGTANTNRMVVLATTKSREGVMDAIRNMRYYASEDCNLQVAFNQGTKPMGSQIKSSGLPAFTIATTDVLPAEESTSTIELWGGAVGGTVPATPIKTFASSSVSFGSSDAENVQPNNTTYYYYAIITQTDGNKAVTAPIWYTREDIVLPVTFTYFNGAYHETRKVVDLKWQTAQEFNSKEFLVERATEGSANYTVIGSVQAAGNSTESKTYRFVDKSPVAGKSLYRLRQVDHDGKVTFSRTVSVSFGKDVHADYTVYPNPAAGFTYINSSSVIAEMVVIRIIDANGRIVKTVNGNISVGAPLKVNLDGIPAGVYLIRVEGNYTHSEKVIVTK